VGDAMRARSIAAVWMLPVYVLLAVLLTWPAVVLDGRAVSVRGDHDINLWNAWWMVHALQQGTSPYATDLLYHPGGISLAQHTLSEANALLAGWWALGLGGENAARLLLVMHYALAGFAFFVLARRLTGCTGGALLAGVLWAWQPYHAHYLAQVNIATLEVLPLAVLALVGCYREGGWRHVLGLALATALLAATCSYYLVYAALLGGLLAVGGRLAFPEVRWTAGCGRLLLAGLAAGLAAALTAWPLVAATLGGASEVAGGLLGDGDRQSLRSNDLLGFSWVGPPERVLVSWPTMLGYTTLLLLAAGHRAVLRHWPWLLAGGLFFVLGLGGELQIGGKSTGVPLPWAALADLPVFTLLRKPDRFFLLTELFVALLAAAAWSSLQARLPPVWRKPLWALALVLLCVEFSLAPLATFERSPSPLLARVAALEATSLVDLPCFGGNPYEARSNRDQTLHGKAIPGGYVTNLALGPEQRASMTAWKRADQALDRGDAGRVVALAAEQQIDLLVLHKTEPVARAAGPLDGRLLWLPFPWVRADLVALRQRGQLVEQAVPGTRLATRRAALVAALGEPLLEDEQIAVFDRRLR